MRPRFQYGKMLSPASKSRGMGGFFLVFKENTNGESLTVIPEDVQALELRIRWESPRCQRALSFGPLVFSKSIRVTKIA